MELNSSMDTEKKYSTYAFGKFSSACYQLAVGAGNIKQRLISASDHFWAVSPEMLPLEIQKDFEWVKKALTEFPAVRDEGEIIATIRRKRTKTLVKIAERIVFIESWLRAHVEEKQNSCIDSWSPPVIALNNNNPSD